MSYQGNNYQGGRAVATAAPAKRELAAPDIQMSDARAMQIGGVAIVPQSLQQIVEFAGLMASAGTAVRKHLRGNTGGCLQIAMQAFRWGMDPFAVASKAFEVNDQIAYEAQLIAAVIIRNAPIKGRPVYDYTGDGNSRRCKVTVSTTDGVVLSYESPAIGGITPKNSPLWKTDPDQQLGYYSVRALARRHFPDILMGVYDPEEAESMTDVTASTAIEAKPAAPARSKATAALDSLQARRPQARHIIENDPPEPEPETVDTVVEQVGAEHDEDGVYPDDLGDPVTVRDENGELVEDERDAPEITIPEMPDDAENAWLSSKRWSAGFKWIMGQAESVPPPVLAHLLMSHADLVAAASAYNADGAAKVANLKKMAGMA